MSREKQKNTGGLELVLMRNAFYRDSYYRVLFAVFLLLVVNASLVFLDYFKWTHPPQPQYFATTPSGQIIKIHPLSDPVLPDDFVLQWTTNALRKTFSLDYVHWRDQLQQAMNYYTSDGWNYLTTALKQSNNLKTLVDLKMVSNVEITSAPQVILKAVVGGHFAWNIRVPIMVTYTNGSKTINQPMEMTVIVMREPVEYYPQKIAINNLLPKTVSPSAYD